MRSAFAVFDEATARCRPVPLGVHRQAVEFGRAEKMHALGLACAEGEARRLPGHELQDESRLVHGQGMSRAAQEQCRTDGAAPGGGGSSSSLLSSGRRALGALVQLCQTEGETGELAGAGRTGEPVEWDWLERAGRSALIARFSYPVPGSPVTLRFPGFPFAFPLPRSPHGTCLADRGSDSTRVSSLPVPSARPEHVSKPGKFQKTRRQCHICI